MRCNEYMVRQYDKYGKCINVEYFHNIVHTIDCVIANTFYSNVLHANIIPTMWVWNEETREYIRICDFNYKYITKTRCINYINRMWVHKEDRNETIINNALAEIERTNFIHE